MLVLLLDMRILDMFANDFRPRGRTATIQVPQSCEISQYLPVSIMEISQYASNWGTGFPRKGVIHQYSNNCAP